MHQGPGLMQAWGPEGPSVIPKWSILMSEVFRFHNKCISEKCLSWQLVLGADTLSPTEVGALSVSNHPNDGRLSSTCLRPSLCSPSPCFFPSKVLMKRHSHTLRDYEKAFPAWKGLWWPIPASQGTFSRCVLANIKELYKLNILGVQRNLFQIFSVDLLTPDA